MRHEASAGLEGWVDVAARSLPRNRKPPRTTLILSRTPRLPYLSLVARTAYSFILVIGKTCDAADSR
eukprot:scaffold3510_cov118-Isochrysis_galbana.AAC.3